VNNFDKRIFAYNSTTTTATTCDGFYVDKTTAVTVISTPVMDSNSTTTSAATISTPKQELLQIQLIMTAAAMASNPTITLPFSTGVAPNSTTTAAAAISTPVIQ